ncbi:MAG: hypothetical protein CFE43_17265 [Burkholderiales bacterium PBB3]|nr:MAG: hypothetical protein CFE43_17265 [Burkholderiales bacterium PBB3]
MTLRRFDTLFVRLFVLMWLTLVLSHMAAFLTVTSGRGGEPPGRATPTFPSLPPGDLWAAHGPEARPPPADSRPMPPSSPPPPPPQNARGPGVGPGPGPGPGDSAPALARADLWLDYGVRLFVIAFGAWLGARWLSLPMRRLSSAAQGLAQSFGGAAAAPSLDEQRGTVEVRDAAAVFNHMALRLQQQFDARGLHMAAVSHDLRTPLTRLRMRIAHIPDASQQQAAAADIHEMDELIGDTLAVLREQNDGSGARPVDVAAFLQALVDDLADQGNAVTLAPPLPMRVLAHPVALRRVLGNLLGNALRHGGSAEVSAERTGQRLQIWVDDRGPGIAPELLTRAFEPWVRLADPVAGAAPQAAKPSLAGHGLGLAIARDLAQRDGGSVSLHNRPGGGLRACLDLPALV